jgi:hypothetical protein
VEARRKQDPTTQLAAAGAERALGCPIGRDVNATVYRDRARRLRSASSSPSPLKTGHLSIGIAVRAERVGEPALGGRNTRGRTPSAPRIAGGSWPSSQHKPTARPEHSTPATSSDAAFRLPVPHKRAVAQPWEPPAQKEVPTCEHVFYLRQRGEPRTDSSNRPATPAAFAASGQQPSFTQLSHKPSFASCGTVLA